MSNNIPKVSVLIPAYNAQNFIQRTIDSALNQTFPDLEIIVVDDGSRDRTSDIIREMKEKDSRINYFYQENQGLSNTRNRLVALAKGEFIAFLDHDDEWLPEKIEKQLKLFEKDKRIGLVFSDGYIKKNEKIIARCFKERKPARGHIFYQYLLSDNFAPLFTVILPKKVLLESMPFNPFYEVNEEFDIFLKIARNYKFDYVDQPLAIYHIHGDNTIISKSKRFIEESFFILDDWIKRDPAVVRLYKTQLRKRRAQLYCKKGFYFLQNNNLSETKKAIITSFKYRFFNIEVVKLSIKLILQALMFRKN